MVFGNTYNEIRITDECENVSLITVMFIKHRAQIGSDDLRRKQTRKLHIVIDNTRTRRQIYVIVFKCYKFDFKLSISYLTISLHTV